MQYNYPNAVTYSDFTLAPSVASTKQQPYPYLPTSQSPQYSPSIYKPMDRDELKEHIRRQSQIYNDIFGKTTLCSLEPIKNWNIESLHPFKKSVENATSQKLLTLTIKVMNAVGKLAVVSGVTLSISLIAASWVAGLPLGMAVVYSLIVASPILGTLLAGKLTCDISAFALKKLKERWFRLSFQAKLNKNDIQNLREWKNVKNLTQIQDRLQNWKNEIEQKKYAEMNYSWVPFINTLGYHLENIKQFQEEERKLGNFVELIIS